MEALGNNEYDASKNYNVIMMKTMMLVVMRREEGIREDGASITVNSLGFAGTFAVKNVEALELLKKLQPTKVLEMLSVPV